MLTGTLAIKSFASLALLSLAFFKSDRNSRTPVPLKLGNFRVGVDISGRVVYNDGNGDEGKNQARLPKERKLPAARLSAACCAPPRSPVQNTASPALRGV